MSNFFEMRGKVPRLVSLFPLVPDSQASHCLCPSWVSMLIIFNQGLFEWDLVSYGAVIHPFRSTGPKATGQSQLNRKV